MEVKKLKLIQKLAELSRVIGGGDGDDKNGKDNPIKKIAKKDQVNNVNLGFRFEFGIVFFSARSLGS